MEKTMFSQLSRFIEDIPNQKKSTATEKIEWLRSQIVEQNVEFVTPFGKRLLTYADHTASGRSLWFIENFILQQVLPVYGNTHTEDSFVGHTTGRLLQEAEKYIKSCMGATDKEAILFCGAGSTSAIKRLQEVMGIAVPSTLRETVLLSTLGKHRRWVVFVGPYEHHSNILSWRQSLAEVVEIPLSKEGVVDLASLKIAIQDPIYEGRPKLGSFSAGSNVTGILTDTRSIARLLHAHGAFACFDFAACAPYVNIDIRSGQADGYDAIFVSAHKFMGGPGTSGILLMSKELYLLGQGPPSTCGGGTVDFVNFNEQNTIYYDSIEHRETAGTPAIIQNVRTALVYFVKEFLTPELISSRESYFIETAISRLSKSNIQVLGSTTGQRIAILSFIVNTTAPLKDTNSPSRELHCSSPIWGNPGQQSPRNFSGLVRRMTGGAKFSLPLQCMGKLLKERPSYVNEPGRAQLVDLAGRHLHGRFVVKLLNDLFGIQARGGCSCAAPYGHRLLEIDETVSMAFRRAIQKVASSSTWGPTGIVKHINQIIWEVQTNLKESPLDILAHTCPNLNMVPEIAELDPKQWLLQYEYPEAPKPCFKSPPVDVDLDRSKNNFSL